MKLKGGLVALAERKSRYVLAGYIRSKHAEGVTAVATRLLMPRKDTATIHTALGSVA